ncbi:MAG: trans-4-hydroxy-L-proline dehydratase [Bacillota bacterium]|jgi:pyruvate formate-lyase/glycerol dehydratase family glycyl radical enzyme
MNERVKRLRQQSIDTPVTLSTERAELVTEFYQENEGKHSAPVMRALNFQRLCEQQTIYIGDDELIVGERGPNPKAVPTYPELTCHSLDDLVALNSREMTSYQVSPQQMEIYRQKVIPYWRGRSLRDRAFTNIDQSWKDLYQAGLFTEFMEQRAPGHTALDGLIYEKGMRDLQAEIAAARRALDWLNDPEAAAKDEELRAMDISCEAIITFAVRHAQLAEELASRESNPVRRAELQRIAGNCRHVPAHAPRDFWEALQMYWFVHLGTVIELNGWDSMSPGHLDQHLQPFYEQGLAEGALTREKAKELLGCFWVKFNNQPAPPKVGVTAAESGTYNDFTNINLGGLRRDGSDGVSEVSYLLLEVLDEMHTLQPQANVQISARTPERFLRAACRVIRKGYGYPSVFNADQVITEQVQMGKTLEDAREGGTSGCIETGCFGKEAYLLTGYLNVPKVLELTLNNGIDPLTGHKIGLETGDPLTFKTFEELYAAFERQLRYVVETKIRINNYLEYVYATQMPAPFLSSVIRDCIAKGKDYYDGGPRYNTTYIQCCGIGTITDSLSALKKHVFEDRTVTMEALLSALCNNFADDEPLRQLLLNRTPCFGNDDDYADRLMQQVYASLLQEIDGRRSTKGNTYHLNMLSTTCHVYFGKMLGATPNGRLARTPISDGTSPSQGADRHGPTAVIKSLAKMDQARSGGTLLNQRFTPTVLEGEEGIAGLAGLIRTYFRLGGHHIQFNVVDTETLRRAQANPAEYRNLLVRVAGYSDYFINLDRFHQEEIIARTAQTSFSG